MPSKGEIEEARRRATARALACSDIEQDVRRALSAGVTAEEVARCFARVLREHGMLASADEVTNVARQARKK
jgi:hypothetical protein